MPRTAVDSDFAHGTAEDDIHTGACGDSISPGIYVFRSHGSNITFIEPQAGSIYYYIVNSIAAIYNPIVTKNNIIAVTGVYGLIAFAANNDVVAVVTVDNGIAATVSKSFTKDIGNKSGIGELGSSGNDPAVVAKNDVAVAATHDFHFASHTTQNNVASGSAVQGIRAADTSISSKNKTRNNLTVVTDEDVVTAIAGEIVIAKTADDGVVACAAVDTKIIATVGVRNQTFNRGGHVVRVKDNFAVVCENQVIAGSCCNR